MLKKRFFLCLAVLCCLCAGAQTAKPVLSILGDSYSTFEGYIPAGNAPWYMQKPDPKRNDVESVRQTWWWQLISEGGYRLGVNESYSGSTVSFTGYRGEDYQDRSFLTRLPRVGQCDVLLVFGATNDSWCGAPLGEFVYTGLTRGHYYEFRPAMGRLVEEAQNRLPGTRVVYIINDGLKDEITASIVEICKHYGAEWIQLRDIDKQSGHPSVKGMRQIKEQVLAYLRK